MPSNSILTEADRIMTICNACRYCEGHCAVFPAMERRLAFTPTDLTFLANLCHNCGSCYHHCQYSEPHEFDVNVPAVFSQIRAETYREFAWPGFLAGLFDRNGLAAGIILVASLILVTVLAILLVNPDVLFAAQPGGNFYAVVPHKVMAYGFGSVGLFVVISLVMSAAKFSRHLRPDPARNSPSAGLRPFADILSMRNLKGGGDGCTYPDETPSHARRWFHHLTFYGFALCFAATSIGTVYHYLFGWSAPYGWFSLPIISGSLGGIGLLIGPAGLLWLKMRADPQVGDPKRFAMDSAFILLLGLTSLTGFLLLGLRETAAMGVLLIVHLGVVLGLFLTLPYGKFVHAVYRSVALFHEAREKGPNGGSGG